MLEIIILNNINVIALLLYTLHTTQRHFATFLSEKIIATSCFNLILPFSYSVCIIMYVIHTHASNAMPNCPWPSC